MLILADPKLLYHGSRYYVSEILQPGIVYTDIPNEWDETESNDFLYAAEDREFAIEMGFAGLLESLFDVKRFSMDEESITVYVKRGVKMPQISALMKRHIYLYTIRFEKTNGWVKVDNAVNNAEGEWKTNKSVSAIVKKEKLVLSRVIKKKVVFVYHP